MKAIYNQDDIYNSNNNFSKAKNVEISLKQTNQFDKVKKYHDTSIWIFADLFHLN